MTHSSTTRRFGATAVILGLALVAALGYQAAAIQQNGRRPAVVAVVNLQAVLEKLDQRAAAQVNMNTARRDLKTADEGYVAELTKLRDDLAKLPEGPERAALQEQFDQKSLKYRAWASFNADKIDIEMALLLQDLYKSVKTSLAQMAATGGYDLIIRNDSLGELAMRADASVSREAQVLQQISERRLLYANDALDITDELIARMNNEFKARGAAAPG